MNPLEPIANRVLIVDDDPVILTLLRRVLGKRFQVVALSDPTQVPAMVAAEPPDLIILDIMMPGLNGFDLCHKLQQDLDTHDIPVIFLTTLEHEEDELRALETGAVDFVTKPIRPAILTARVRNHLRMKQCRDRLAASCQIDALTEIANRRSLIDTLDNEWRRALREPASLSIVMADVDLFKQFNDRYGHLYGDLCLKTVAQTLKQSFQRPGDLVARFGGEEFCIILPNTSAEDAERLANDARAAIAKIKIEHSASPLGMVTISMGVASCKPRTWMEPTELLASADRALYAAKAQGRNCVCVEHPVVSKKTDASLSNKA